MSQETETTDTIQIGSVVQWVVEVGLSALTWPHLLMRMALAQEEMARQLKRIRRAVEGLEDSYDKVHKLERAGKSRRGFRGSSFARFRDKAVLLVRDPRTGLTKPN